MGWDESSSEAKFLFEILGIPEKERPETKVVKFTAYEMISTPFELNITLACEDEIALAEVVGKEALLTIIGDVAERYLHGIINEFMHTGSKGRFQLYEARVVPSLWLLSLEQDCRIFQDPPQSVPQIVKQILQERGITADRIEERQKKENYKPREYCVQYRETDLNFISRLLEEEGIFYFFEHFKDKHVLVLGDSRVAYKPIPRKEGEKESVVEFKPAEGMVPEKECVYGFAFSQRILSGKYTYKDFNFKQPSLDLKADEQGKSYQKLEIYDYPGKYQDQSRGKKLVETRLQELITFKSKAEGQGVCPRFAPGLTFKLTEHDRKDFNQEYLLVEVIHTGSQPQVLEEHTGAGQGSSYSNSFLVIPSDVTFRPERKTPKPIVEGAQTAIVVGTKDKKFYTDEEKDNTGKLWRYGQVKVQFHWDRKGEKDEKSSCWIRVAYPYAGGKHGMQFTPLIGDEVIVVFLEGDPDCPVVTGSLFKGDDKALIPPAKMIANEILTPYGHRLLLSDKGGSITMNTGGGETVFMGDGKEDKTDHGNNIKISTADGHYIHLAQGNGFKGITMYTKNNHLIRMFQMPEQSEIMLYTEKGHMINLTDTNDNISITDRTGDLNIVLDAKNGNIEIKNNKGKIVIDSKDEINIKSQKKILMEAPDIQIIGSGYVKVESSGAHDVKGNPVKINC